MSIDPLQSFLREAKAFAAGDAQMIEIVLLVERHIDVIAISDTSIDIEIYDQAREIARQNEPLAVRLGALNALVACYERKER